ncbi:hypothetical protein BDY21DRAFT_373621 [Lineolata rhizophorae]|uniref:BZIP domain-containing protein n=1 Tax=Lineolata rhizophorae TaxID=578093 RepID=A0A6A6NTQ7_9PEZI|nr:hypothetical protein BDY21DRAFT_373621 [Lineolata rhizophorae]
MPARLRQDSFAMETQQYDYWVPQSGYMNGGLYDSASSLSPSPKMSTPYDHLAMNMPLGQIPEELSYGYQMALTPSDFGSADESSPYCSPSSRPTDVAYIPAPPPQPAPERTHTTSGRRRAQNRAAQRAFRERKEKHARDLETQLAAMTEKYRSLETSHAELTAAYEKLRKTIELLTQPSDGEIPSNADTLRKLLDILHGEIKIKTESAC